MVVMAQDLDEVQNGIQYAMRGIENWLLENELELAVEKTEIVIVTSKKRVPIRDFLVLGRTIKPKPEIKYLGIWIDCKLNFNAHIRKTATKASNAMTALGRLLPNIGGPQASKRQIICSVSRSILLYAAPVWEEAMKHKCNRNIYERIQRQSAMRICSSYRTVSTEAIQVIAEQPPIDLLIEHAAVISRVDHADKKEARERGWETLMEKWQARWQNGTHGRWTARLIPTIRPWMERKHGETDFYLTQMLTGHGCFKDFTYRINKSEDNECIYCGEIDTAEHTIFFCRHFKTDRDNCVHNTGTNITPDNIIEFMLRSKENWEVINRMITNILKLKIIDEKETQEHPEY